MSSDIEYYTVLNSLITNGIHVDKNLRQPFYYSSISFDELKNECTCVITDLLTNQRLPHWLSQRISWYYSNKYFQEIVTDLSLSNQNENSQANDEPKYFNREKIVVYLRNSISEIAKEWLNERSNLNNQNLESLLFSFNRTEKKLQNSLVYYEFSLKNKRRTMEDRTSIYENIDLLNNYFLHDSNRNDNKKSNSFFGIFDGHCGTDCAQYVSTHLPLNIIQHNEIKEKIESNLNMKEIFVDSFEFVNRNFSNKALKENLRSGCTACVAILSTSNKLKEKYTKLNVAWCGDTQFCLVKNGKINYLTHVHKPEIESERKRIETNGGQVVCLSNIWRVNGSLSVSRSFGDVDYQSSGVTSQPEVKQFDLDGTEDYFIIACDGFWESVKLDELVCLIYDNVNTQNMAEFLVRHAKENGSTDNISVIFVLLKENMDEITKPFD